jgi:hypothetical protein
LKNQIILEFDKIDIYYNEKNKHTLNVMFFFIHIRAPMLNAKNLVGVSTLKLQRKGRGLKSVMQFHSSEAGFQKAASDLWWNLECPWPAT